MVRLDVTRGVRRLKRPGLLGATILSTLPWLCEWNGPWKHCSGEHNRAVLLVFPVSCIVQELRNVAGSRNTAVSANLARQWSGLALYCLQELLLHFLVFFFFFFLMLSLAMAVLSLATAISFGLCQPYH